MAEQAVDRGGLEYTLKVEDQSGNTLEQFQAKIKAARDALDEMAKGAGSFAQATRQTAQSTKELGTSSERAAAGFGRSAEALKEKARGMTSMQRAIRRYRSQWQGILFDQKVAEVADDKRFRNEKEHLTTLQARRKAEKDITSVMDQRMVNEQRRVAALMRNEKLTAREVKKLKILTEMEQMRADASERLRIAQNRQSDSRLRKLSAEAEIQERINRAQHQLRVREGMAARGLRPDGMTPEEFNRKTAAMNRFTTSMKQSGNVANRISFTFRRLFGILAAFTLARFAVGGIRDMISQAVRFNAEMEQIELGIASLLTAVGTIRNATGELVTGVEALSVAQKEARRQSDLLRRDALTTAATFEQLVEAFQTAIAPGMAAGLDIDQVRRFTVSISRAAQAMGLPQKQLATEIRKLFEGTIDPRNTRIASALGITNENIRRVKETGQLVEFLAEKFEAFDIAGQASLNTFNVILSDVKNALQLVLGTGGRPLFDELKGFLRDFNAVLVTSEGQEGLTIVNPKAVAFVDAILSGLRGAVQAGRELIATLRFEDTIQIARAVGLTLEGTARAIAAVFRGLVEGLGDIANIVNFIAPVLRSLVNADIEKTISAATRLATVVIGAMMAVNLIRGSLALITKSIAALKLATTLAPKATAATGAFTVAQLGLSGAGVGAGVVAGSGAGAAAGSGGILAKLMALVKGGIFIKLGALLGAAAAKAALIVGAVVAIGAGVISLVAWIERASGKTGTVARGFEWIRDLIAQVAEIFGIVAGTTLAAVGTGVNRLLNDVRQLTNADLGLEEQVRSVADELDTARVSIRGARESLSQMAETMGRLREEATKARNEMMFELDYGHLIGFARDLQKIISDSKDAFSDASAKMVGEREDALRRMTDAQNRFDALSIKSAGLRDEDLRALKRIRFYDERRVLNLRRLTEIEKEREALIRQGMEMGKEVSEGKFVVSPSEDAKELWRAAERLRIEEENIKQENEAALAILSRMKRDYGDLFDTATGLARAEVARVGALKDMEQIQEDLNDLYEDFLTSIMPKFVAASRRELHESRLRAEQVEIENRFRLQMLAAEQMTIAARRTAEANAHRDRMVAETELSQVSRERHLDAVDGQLAFLENLKAEINDQEKIAEIQDAINELSSTRNALQREHLLLLDDESHKRAELQRNAEETARREARPFSEGVRAGFQRLQDDVLDTALFIENTFVSMVDSLSATIADSIVDAFDPTTDRGLKDRIGAFLRDISRMVLQEMARIAVVRGLMAAGMGAALGGPVSPGMADGGNVADAWQRARGYAGGGRPTRSRRAPRRPRGLHPSDRIPIWAAPGEWVIRARSAMTYGSAVMDRINKGLVDPTGLQALAGVGRVSRTISAPKGPGFASGGLVARTRRAAPAAVSAAPASSQGPAVAVIAPTEAGMDRLLHGGKNAMLDFFAENSDLIRNRLGV